MLVVDDYPEAYNIFRLCLKRQFNIVVAATLNDGIVALGENPDVVVVDYYLPDGEGPKLLPHIDGGTPAFLVTGAPDVAAEEEATGRWSAVFAKPYDCYEIGDRALQLLGA